jgi:hypothetical protein
MRRMTEFFVVCGLVTAVFFTGCKKNRPPTAPQLSGPTLGNPAETLTYTFSSTDPENQEVVYTVAWGDTSTAEWSSSYASGQQVTRAHSYPDSGVYYVKVKARDTQLAESEWSDSVVVSIVSSPPHRPAKPLGPASCTTGIACTFTASTNHPQDDSVWFQFDWGGTVGNWGGPVASDSLFHEQHVFDSVGTFSITVRARDAQGDTSEWSESLHVSVVRPAPPAKPDVSCEATNTGADLRLSWPAVPEAESYEVKVDDSTYSTTSLSFDVTTPSATIEVRTVNGNGKSGPATIDCRTVETPTLVVYGISDPDSAHHCGFAFNSYGTITTYSLLYSNLALLDFYADDVVHPGQMYLVNPGDKGWNDKGNAGKASASSAYDDVKIADAPGGYVTQLALQTSGIYCLWLDRTNNGWDAQDNFAKTEVIAIAGPLLAMRVGYQKIPGLRWLVN